jgi:hypothetical protein
MEMRALTILSAAAVLTFAVPSRSSGQAHDGRGFRGLGIYYGVFDGGWSKTEESTAPGGTPVRFEFSNGFTAGALGAFGITRNVSAWAAAELNVEDDGPFPAFFAGLAARAAVASRLSVEARLGAGRLDVGPFGTVGATAEWQLRRSLALGAGVYMVRPIGAGSRNNGLQQVEVEYDGGPTRLQVELGWRPGR